MLRVYPIIRIEGRNTVELIFMYMSMADILLTGVTASMIFKKTPEHMKKYKYVTLNFTTTGLIYAISLLPIVTSLSVYHKTKEQIDDVVKKAIYESKKSYVAPRSYTSPVTPDYNTCNNYIHSSFGIIFHTFRSRSIRCQILEPNYLADCCSPQSTEQYRCFDYNSAISTHAV
ncbi:unnamed protein product [Cylicocyclus nassatus]|uniref:Uncharacterized protein n=1 Tax=Cylicocyclus nassatus TaxID=53992 RepID=A0AA36H4H3_CYLNA|nr:unnamed protein product [Cylicocyclus nassatus]